MKEIVENHLFLVCELFQQFELKTMASSNDDGNMCTRRVQQMRQMKLKPGCNDDAIEVLLSCVSLFYLLLKISIQVLLYVNITYLNHADG